MKTIAFLLIFCSLFVSCTSSKRISQSGPVPESSLVSDRDGSSYEKAIIIKEKSESPGIAAEYAWLRKNYPGYQSKGQSLTFNNKKPFDLISIVTAEGVEKTIYFDISGFYGKF